MTNIPRRNQAATLRRTTSARMAALSLLLTLASPSQAADRHVTLAVPPPVTPGLAAMPQIATPADPAERRVNAALSQLDAKVRAAAAACRADADANASWGRTVQATLRGPGFLSLLITDDTYCGSAYPNHGVATITYDLATGAPVDWTKLLPATLTGTVALQEQSDGTRMVTLASIPLMRLYRAGYVPPPGEAAPCRTVIHDLPDEGAAMMPWLDANAGGLAVQFDLPHAVEVCATPVVIPAAVLRRAGVSPRLLAALAAARLNHP